MAEGAKTSSGMQENLAGLLCYAFGWISGLIFYLTEKENKTVRFHAMQSIIIGIASVILCFIPIVNFVAIPGFFILWIVMMVTTYQGKKIKLPLVGDIAEKNA